MSKKKKTRHFYTIAVAIRDEDNGTVTKHIVQGHYNEQPNAACFGADLAEVIRAVAHVFPAEAGGTDRRIIDVASDNI